MGNDALEQFKALQKRKEQMKERENVGSVEVVDSSEHTKALRDLLKNKKEAKGSIKEDVEDFVPKVDSADISSKEDVSKEDIPQKVEDDLSTSKEDSLNYEELDDSDDLVVDVIEDDFNTNASDNDFVANVIEDDFKGKDFSANSNNLTDILADDVDSNFSDGDIQEVPSIVDFGEDLEDGGLKEDVTGGNFVENEDSEDDSNDLVKDFAVKEEVYGSDTNNGKNTLFAKNEDVSKDVVADDGVIIRNGVKGKYVIDSSGGIERRVWKPLEEPKVKGKMEEAEPIATNLASGPYIEKVDPEGNVIESGVAVDGLMEDGESTLERARKLKESLDEQFKATPIASKGSTMTFETTEGEIIEPRMYDKGMYLDAIDKDKITVGMPVRKGDSNILELQEDIKRVGGVLEPLTVVPVGKAYTEKKELPNGKVVEKLVFEKYILLHGYRRYEACLHLNINTIPCIVDMTIPFELINVYMPSYNNVQPYKFSERLERANVIRELLTQESVPFSVVENMAGFETGDWYKGLYISEMKNDFPQYYNDVESRKLTIKQAFNKLNKDIEKRDKEENEGEDGANEDDILRDKNTDELQEIQNEVNKQKLGERTPLATGLRREIEIRDAGVCQFCGFPLREKKDEHGQIMFDDNGDPILEKDDDLSSRMEIEHLMGVNLGGVDVSQNLYVICQRCHSYLENYYNNKYTPSQNTYKNNKWVRRMVIAGNMKKKAKQHAIARLKKEDPQVYKKVDSGKLTVGRALESSKINFDPLAVFGGNPVEVMFNEFKKLDDDDKTSPLNDIDYMGDDLGDIQELKHNNPTINK